MNHRDHFTLVACRDSVENLMAIDSVMDSKYGLELRTMNRRVKRTRDSRLQRNNRRTRFTSDHFLHAIIIVRSR